MIKKVVFVFIFVLAACGNSFSEGAEEAHLVTEQVGKVNSDAEIVEEDEVFPLFEENECAVPPNLLQKTLVFLTGTQQNHWTVENALKFYAPLVAGCYSCQLYNNHLGNPLLTYFGVEVLQHYLTDKRVLIPSDAAGYALSSTWLSDHAGLGNLFKKHEFRYRFKGNLFYYLKRLFMRVSRGAKTENLIANIEAECKKLSIESAISYGSVPENENFLLLESPKTMYLELARAFLGRMLLLPPERNIYLGPIKIEGGVFQGMDFDLKRAFLHYVTKGSGTEDPRFFNEFSPISQGAFWLMFGVRVFLAGLYLQSYFFNRIIIPYSTIQKLSPALQDRCYDLMWLNKTQL